MAAEILTLAQAQEKLSYDHSSGVFTWRVSPSAKVRAGSPAGAKQFEGYIVIGLNGRRYMAHRLAWLFITSGWPDGDIDHINGVKSDNRSSNLRLVTRAENLQNQRTVSSNNKNGSMLGVAFHRPTNKWRARIGLGGKDIHIGLFATESEAHQAYVAAKRAMHPAGNL